MGLLVAIEGIDGSGKGTQASRLHQRLLQVGRQAELFSFPRYEANFFGQAVGRFLDGQFGALDQVHPFLASLLYAGDRFESRQLIRDAAERNDFVIFDRYVASNIAHQGAKLAGAERENLIQSIEQLEYGIYELPRPDRVILLDIPAQQAQQLIASKAPRSYTEKAADLQEADAAYLQSVADIYRQLAQRDPHWHTVHCTAGDSIRTIDEIAEEIWAIVTDESR